MKLVIYIDTSYANLPDGVASTGAFIIVSRKDKTNVLSWSLTKTKRVAAVVQKD